MAKILVELNCGCFTCVKQRNLVCYHCKGQSHIVIHIIIIDIIPYRAVLVGFGRFWYMNIVFLWSLTCNTDSLLHDNDHLILASVIIIQCLCVQCLVDIRMYQYFIIRTCIN